MRRNRDTQDDGTGLRTLDGSPTTNQVVAVSTILTMRTILTLPTIDFAQGNHGQGLIRGR